MTAATANLKAGSINWLSVSKYLPGRSPKACETFYHRKLKKPTGKMKGGGGGTNQENTGTAGNKNPTDAAIEKRLSKKRIAERGE
jgi:hypothetical protein